MKYVKKQIEFIRELLDRFENTLYDRSHWRTGTINARKRRIQEAQAILKACETLVELTKSAEVEILSKDGGRK